LDFKNQIPVAIVEPATGIIKLEKLTLETDADDWVTPVFVHSGGNQLTPLDDYW
jgi:hypothetical protein